MCETTFISPPRVLHLIFTASKFTAVQSSRTSRSQSFQHRSSHGIFSNLSACQTSVRTSGRTDVVPHGVGGACHALALGLGLLHDGRCHRILPVANKIREPEHLTRYRLRFPKAHSTWPRRSASRPPTPAPLPASGKPRVAVNNSPAPSGRFIKRHIERRAR